MCYKPPEKIYIYINIYSNISVGLYVCDYVYLFVNLQFVFLINEDRRRMAGFER